jgi:hypothetical protein
MWTRRAGASAEGTKQVDAQCNGFWMVISSINDKRSTKNVREFIKI